VGGRSVVYVEGHNTHSEAYKWRDKRRGVNVENNANLWKGVCMEGHEYIWKGGKEYVWRVMNIYGKEEEPDGV